MYAQNVLLALLAATGALAAPAPAGLQKRDYDGTICAATCTQFHDACIARAGSSKPECAVNYSNCLGYSPYESGQLVPPTTCHFYSTQSPADAACADECNQAHNACIADPDGNTTICASNWVACLDYNPYSESSGLVVPTVCKPQESECYKTYQSCLNSGISGKTLCASNYAGCLGYNPYTS